MEQEPRNLWLSACEREALLSCLRGIALAVLQLRYERSPLKAADRSALTTAEQSCQRMRLLLEFLDLAACGEQAPT